MDDAIIEKIVKEELSAVTAQILEKVKLLQTDADEYLDKFMHPHKLRHSFASIAITNGADVASVSEKLGHSDKAVTLRMYTHANEESIKRASQIFREALKNQA